MALACDVIWQFQWRNSILNIDIEDIIILLALIELLPPLSNGIHNIANLLPGRRRAVPLSHEYNRWRLCGQECQLTWWASIEVPFLTILTWPDFFPVRGQVSEPMRTSLESHLVNPGLLNLEDCLLVHLLFVAQVMLGLQPYHRML